MLEIMVMVEYFQFLILDCWVGDGDDLISKFVYVFVDGEVMMDEDIVGFCMFFLIVGNEIIINLISNFFYYVVNNLDFWVELCVDLLKVDVVVEEILCY